MSVWGSGEDDLMQIDRATIVFFVDMCDDTLT